MPQKRSKKKWLSFHPYRTEPGGQLQKVYVKNRKTGDELGEIEYCNGWRQYVWHPECNIQFGAGCLREMADYLDSLNWTKGCYKQKIRRPRNETS